jgi:hypothetical protein
VDLAGDLCIRKPEEFLSRMQTDDERYRISPFRHFTMGGSSEMLYSMLSRKTLEVVRGTGERLRRLGTAKPLGAYIDALSTVTNNPASLIHALLEARIIVSSGYFLDACNENRSESRASISCIATPTRGRSQLLPLTFGSYVADLQKYGHTPDLLIADDSVEKAEQDATFNAVEEIVRVSGRPIAYASRVEKLAFLDTLANECDAPEAVLRFAMVGDSRFRITTGANRNGIALYAAGRLLLTVDDDSRCSPVCMSDDTVRQCVTLGGGRERPSAWKMTERHEALVSNDSTSWDVVGQHELFLGKTLSDVAAVHRAKLQLNEHCDRLLMDLSRGRGQVITTFTGVAGDPGIRSSALIAMQRQYESQQAMDNESQYSEHLRLRDIVRHFPSTTICRSGFLMTTAVGLDHRVLLPPFFPVCRNQDGLFVAVVRRIHPQGYFAHLPFALTHKPLGIRKNDSRWMSSTRIADQIIEFVAMWPEPLGQQAADSRCRSLGDFLIGISRMRQAEFEEMTRVLLLKRATRFINHCETAIAHYDGQPEFWARDLCDRIAEIRQAAIRADVAVPCDLAALFSSDNVHDATQQLIRQFGELLCWWPEIVKSTESLAEGGVRLGTIITPH